MRQQLSDLLKTSFDSFMANVHTCTPGKIESFDFTKNKASVKPLIKKKFENGETLDMPVITDVPVIFPGSAKGGIAFQLSPGDGCLVLFSEKSMEDYLLGSVQDADPSDPRRFSLTDAICLPGLFPFGSPGSTGNGSDFVINWNGNVNINEGSNGAARKEDSVGSTPVEDSTYWLWLLGLMAVFIAWVPVPGDGGAVLKTAISTYLTTNPTPQSLDSKITGGSTSVKIGG